MEKLNAEQIIKALECCCGDIVECQKCAYVKNGYNRCKERASQDALSLINSQEQKIKELTEENESLRAENETLKVATNDQYAHLCDCHDKIAEMLRQKESDTVRKMQERVLQLFPSDKNFTTISRFSINQIAKEMLEG